MHTGITPVGKLTKDQVQSVLVAASTAPSPHHRHPWRAHCTPMTLELYANPDRRVAASAGLDRRRLLLACGAALLNLRLAISAQGVYPDVRILPDPTQPELLAVVRPQSRRPVTPIDQELAAAIGYHATDRQPEESVAILAPFRDGLRRAAEIERAWLATISSVQLPTLRAIMGRASLAEPNDSTSVKWADTTGVIAVIGTFHDQSATHLQAGQAMQRVALTAATIGLFTTFLSQVVEVPATRRELRELIGGGLWPQVLLRLEEAPPPPTPPPVLSDGYGWQPARRLYSVGGCSRSSVTSTPACD